MKEAVIQRWVRDFMRSEFGPLCVYIKYHAGPYASRGVCDLIFCIEGLFVAIEVKTEIGTLTEIQQLFIHKVNDAGGKAYVIYGKDRAQIRSIIDDIRSSLPR